MDLRTARDVSSGEWRSPEAEGAQTPPRYLVNDNEPLNEADAQAGVEDSPQPWCEVEGAELPDFDWDENEGAADSFEHEQPQGSILPVRQADPRIHTYHITPEGDDQEQDSPPPPVNPLAVAVDARLKCRTNLADGTEQDPRVNTQPIQPPVMAGQDYRVQTQAFPPGLLESEGIVLTPGGLSTVATNDAVMRSIAHGAESPNSHDEKSQLEETGSVSSRSESNASSTISGGAARKIRNYRKTDAKSKHAAASLHNKPAAAGVSKQSRNRDAAKEYRRRKKEYMEELQNTVKMLESERAALQLKMGSLEGENARLRELVPAPLVAAVHAETELLEAANVGLHSTQQQLDLFICTL